MKKKQSNEIVSLSKFGFMRTGVEWHIMPVVNPDGYEFTHTNDRFWRKNRNPNTDPATRTSQIESGAYMSGCGEYRGIGVDLNRNYDAMWRLGDPMVGASKWCTDDSYQGASAFSEPETKAHSGKGLKITESFKKSLSFMSPQQSIFCL